MSRSAHIVALTLLVLLTPSSSSLAAPIWTWDTLPPSGDLTGAPGATVGWGYEIVNPEATRWLVITALTADPFVSGTPDASVFDFPIVPPGSSVARSFDAVLMNGLFGFTWDPGTPSGTTNSGTFVMSADWYGTNPLAGGLPIEAAPDVSAPYSVRAAGVPEPAVTMLLTLSALGVGLRGLRRRSDR